MPPAPMAPLMVSSSFDRLSLNPVYTIQPAVQPVEQPVGQPAVSCKRGLSRSVFTATASASCCVCRWIVATFVGQHRCELYKLKTCLVCCVLFAYRYDVFAHGLLYSMQTLCALTYSRGAQLSLIKGHTFCS